MTILPQPKAASPEFTPAQKLEAFHDLAFRLCGDVCIVPVIDGVNCFDVKSSHDLTTGPQIETDLEDPSDVGRLCVLTDGFDRFTNNPSDADVAFVSYLDYESGDVKHVQIAGSEDGSERALAAMARGLAGEGMRGELLDLIQHSSLLRHASNDNKPMSKAPRPEPLPVINPTDWQDYPIPDRQWLIPGLIPSRTVTLLSGDGGTGKTLLALQIGMATALNCPAWGEAIPLPGRCLYIGAEDEAEEFHRRMAAILGGFQKSFADLDGFRLVSLAERDALLMVESKGKLIDTPLLAQVIDEITSFRPTLIVLDTSADLFGGDEIKRPQVRQFVAAFRQIAIKLDCAVLLLSHPSVAGIQSGSGISGSTAWNNSVRSRLYLTAPSERDVDPDSRVLTTMKANYGPKGAKIDLRWQRGVFVQDDGAAANPARAILDKRADEVFLALLSKLNRQGQNLSPNPSQSHAPRVMAAHSDARGVSKKHLVAAQQRLLDQGKIQIVEEGPPSRRYKRLLVSAEVFGPDQQPSN